MEVLDPTKQYTIEFEAEDQAVKTRVSSDTLHLDFFQNLNFLVDPKEYRQSWALHVTQDFSKSSLASLHYLVFFQGNYTLDWVPLNMNDVHPSQISSMDTLVNGKKFIKVKLRRTFHFYSVPGSRQEAINQQNRLVESHNEQVDIAAFYSVGTVYSLPNKRQLKLKYNR